MLRDTYNLHIITIYNLTAQKGLQSNFFARPIRMAHMYIVPLGVYRRPLESFMIRVLTQESHCCRISNARPLGAVDSAQAKPSLPWPLPCAQFSSFFGVFLVAAQFPAVLLVRTCWQTLSSSIAP